MKIKIYSWLYISTPSWWKLLWLAEEFCRDQLTGQIDNTQKEKKVAKNSIKFELHVSVETCSTWLEKSLTCLKNVGDAFFYIKYLFKDIKPIN